MRIVYTEEQKEFLKEISYGKSEKEITKLFNEKFNTNISAKKISSLRKRIGALTGNTGLFEKGHISWNKGTKGLTSSNITSYKKGHIPNNYRPVGSQRLSKDGYIEIKIKDPNKWQLKHRYIWEKEFGKVPRGHTLIFLDQDKMNIKLDNLELISRSELLILNRKKWTSDNPNITKQYIQLARLRDKINKKKRK